MSAPPHVSEPNSASQPAQTMRCGLVNRFGATDDVMEVSEAFPRPTPGPGQLLIRVLTCSLSPGDYRFSSGDTDLFKKPRDGKFPYIPGGDVCGYVVQLGPADPKATGGSAAAASSAGSVPNAPFKVGDCIVATWDPFGIDGIAEYALVKASLAVLKPESISALDGAALANSAGHALLAVDKAVKVGDRMLVIGGSGGVGSSLVQLARRAGASYIACVSTDRELMTRLGADRVIDYREQNWWELTDEPEPFDIVFDCAVGKTAWEAAQHSPVVKKGKQGGRFYAFVLHEWRMVVHKYWHIIKLLIPLPFWRLRSKLRSGSVPEYMFHLQGVDGPTLARVLKLVDQGELHAVVDPLSPFPLTTEGLRGAFNHIESRHAHGKVVIQVSSQEEPEDP